MREWGQSCRKPGKVRQIHERDKDGGIREGRVKNTDRHEGVGENAEKSISNTKCELVGKSNSGKLKSQL